MAKPIPDGYHSVQPYLYFKNAADAIAFYAKAFGATERLRMADKRRPHRSRRNQPRRLMHHDGR